MLMFSNSLKQNVTWILVSRDSQNESAKHLKIKNLQVKLRGVRSFFWSPAAFHFSHLMRMHLSANPEQERKPAEQWGGWGQT